MFWKPRHSKDPKKIAEWAYVAVRAYTAQNPTASERDAVISVLRDRYAGAAQDHQQQAFAAEHDICCILDICMAVLRIEADAKQSKDARKEQFLECVAQLIQLDLHKRSRIPSIAKTMLRIRTIEEEVANVPIDGGYSVVEESLSWCKDESIMQKAKWLIDQEVAEYRAKLKGSLLDAFLGATFLQPGNTDIFLADDDREFRNALERVIAHNIRERDEASA